MSKPLPAVVIMQPWATLVPGETKKKTSLQLRVRRPAEWHGQGIQTQGSGYGAPDVLSCLGVPCVVFHGPFAPLLSDAPSATGSCT